MPKNGGIALTLGICVSVLLWANGDQSVRAVLLGTDREQRLADGVSFLGIQERITSSAK